MSTETFTPRWASAPGDTLIRWLDARGVEGDELPELIGRSHSWCSSFLTGAEPLDGAAAEALGALTATPAAFWLSREVSYREDRRRVEADSWAQGLPMSDMARLGWLPRAKDWKEQAALALSYFGVSNVSEWQMRHDSFMSTAKFRTRQDPTLSSIAVSVWIRQCERTAPRTSAGFELDEFEQVLAEVRRLTRWADPARFVPKLGRILSSSGVRLAIVPALPGSGISGACWRDSEGAPIIGLTARSLVEDQFWFSFFHEAAHIILHHKNGPFVDALEETTTESGQSADSVEQAADARAIELMLERPNMLMSVQRSATLREVARVAAANDTSVGVIVGQLQHLGILDYTQRNSWKRRYRWNRSILEKK